MKYIILPFLFLLNFNSQKHILGVEKFQKPIDIFVYGSDTCHYCLSTKTFLKNKNIDFIYYDVDVNLDKQKEMILKLQNAGIPLDAIVLPIVDLRGTIKVNDVANFEDFLNRLTENKK